MRRNRTNDEALLPWLTYSTTIVGTCKDWGDKCTIDAKKKGRILYITNQQNGGGRMKVGVLACCTVRGSPRLDVTLHSRQTAAV